MNKPFLLIAGDNYYPSGGTGDWIGKFETREEIEKNVETRYLEYFFTKGPRKGQLKEKARLGVTIFGIKYDWYEIVDLRDWLE